MKKGISIRTVVALSSILLLSLAVPGMAKVVSGSSTGCSGRTGTSFNVTSNILGTDSLTLPPQPFQFLSDGKGSYTTYKISRTDSDTSEIQGNTCDWVLDLSNSKSRTVQLSLGFPVSTGESLPPGWPTDGSLVTIPALVRTNCAANSANGTNSVGNMTAVGETLQCGFHLAFFASNGVQYMFRFNASSYPGATWGQVTCTGMGPTYCNDWTVTPGVDANGMTAINPYTQQATGIGELVLPPCTGCDGGTPLGLYYVEFSATITNP